MRAQRPQTLAAFAVFLLISNAWGGQTPESPITVGYSTLFGGPGADDCDAIEIDGAGIEVIWPQLTALAAMTVTFLILGSVLFKWRFA